MSSNILCGIDFILNNPSARYLNKKNFILISGSNVINQFHNPVYIEVKKIFGRYFKEIWSLQHGFFIDKQDNMILSDSFFSKELQIKIKSFYNKDLTPKKEDIKNIDLIIVDIFDVGTRVYTFLNHIVKILDALNHADIKVLIADRPNPLGGEVREGNCASKEFFSIVSMIDIPMRHGLTAAEFLIYAQMYHQIDLDIKPIKIRNWKRSEFFNSIWTYPSPNMPKIDTALLYPGAVLLEGTNLSEGRGTTRPFEIFGAPYLDNIRLCHQLGEKKFAGIEFIPVFFKPEFSKYKGKICKGILLHILDKTQLRSFEVFYEILRLINQEYKDQFAFSKYPYEFEFKRPAIDMICGSDLIRKSLENNKSYREISERIQKDISAYQERIKEYLLY